MNRRNLRSFSLALMLCLTSIAFTSKAQTIVSGLQTANPFLATDPNATAVATWGAAVIKAPTVTTNKRTGATTMTFGTGNARTGGFAADSANASFTTADAKGEWVEFAISPALGYTLNITGITLTGNGTRAGGRGPVTNTNNYAVAFAVNDTTLFSSGNGIFLDSAGNAGNTLYTTAGYLASGQDTTGQNIIIPSGSTVYLRIYMWNASNTASTSVFTVTNFVISGSVTAIQGSFSITNQTICNGSSYTFNGVSYSQPGTYTDTIVNGGVDSLAVLNLKVTPPAKLTYDTLIGCGSVTFNGKTYTSSTVFVDTVPSSLGCDSIYQTVYVVISCSPYVTSFSPTTGATGDTITIKGINFNDSSWVSFGGIPAAMVIFINDTTLQAIVGAGSSGYVAVVTLYGVDSLAGFSYNPANIIKGIQAATPFLNAGTNISAAVTYGSGITQVPQYKAAHILFGTNTNAVTGAPAAGFAADGAGATWSTASQNGEYVQFAITPAQGYNMTINGITIKGNGTAARGGRGGADNNYYSVSYSIGDSTQFDAGNSIFLDSAGNAGNTLYTQNSYLASGADSTGLGISVGNNVFYIRIYLWNASTTASTSQFTITNFTISGVLTTPLPVSLVSLAAKATSNGTLVQWNTAKEANMSSFGVESSKDGVNFNEVGSVTAKNNAIDSYSFTDKVTVANTVYYRLKMIDNTGAYNYSKVVSVNMKNGDFTLTAYPNPTKNTLTISGIHIATVSVIDNLGRILSSQTLNDATNPTVNVSNLPTGMYHLRVQTTDGSFSKASFIKE